MEIFLMRHFKVDFEWKKNYTSEEFKMASEAYNTAGIIHQSIANRPKNVQIYISELRRSRLTYEALGIHRKPFKTNLINEVPMTPFMATHFIVPTFIWMAMGRLQWFFNSDRQPESKRDTLKRIGALVEQLEREGKDTLIIGHGFYFSQLKRVLKKSGYSGSGKNHYKNGEIVMFEKANS